MGRTDLGYRRRVRLDETSDQWWKNAVVYCLDIEKFADSDGDGIGDINGLISRIDYLAGLGVTCIWLMPFQPTPNRDDGYDITDYYGIDERLGTPGEFVELVRTAADRGIRVIIDLVPNHTSDQHPWFQEARSDPDSPKRDWYVWRDKPSDEPKGLFFPNKETSNWAYDRKAKQYYLHRFYSYQPDLNTANPDVRDEIAAIMGYWLQMGVSGFRVDAVPALLETEGLPERVKEDPREWLRRLRTFVGRRSGDAVLLGEVNVEAADLGSYFGDNGDLLHMQFAFLLNQYLWLAFAREEAEPLEMVIRELPKVPPDNAWATFLRNHDELTLDKLTGPQMKQVFKAFGPQKKMQLYGHGIRRRLAPMLKNDPDRLRLAWSILFSLPGTPVVLWGDEVGLAEDLKIEDRYSVRVPMDWEAVADQRRDRDSLLMWMERMIRSRREHPEFGWGNVTLIETAESSLFAHKCDTQDSAVVAVHNLAAGTAKATVELGEDVTGVEDLLEARDHKVMKKGTLDVELGAYGYLWLKLQR
jgi:trehalose synthase